MASCELQCHLPDNWFWRQYSFYEYKRNGYNIGFISGMGQLGVDRCSWATFRRPSPSFLFHCRFLWCDTGSVLDSTFLLGWSDNTAHRMATASVSSRVWCSGKPCGLKLHDQSDRAWNPWRILLWWFEWHHNYCFTHNGTNASSCGCSFCWGPGRIL